MTSDNRPRPLFTLRTDELAGRDEELQKLKKTLDELQQTPDKTLLFYIAGDGGMGKTRILQWVKQQPFSPKTFCTNILDFYNSILRTDVDLVEQIYDDIEEPVSKLPKNLSEGFHFYRDLRDRYRRQEVGATGGQFREKVIEAFYEAWLPLAKADYRLIVLLDTAELLRFEDDAIRKAFEPFGAKEPTASAKLWLEKVVGDSASPNDKTLPGVLFVIAGRKEEAKDLYASFCKLAGLNIANPEDRIVDLAGLRPEGVEGYLAALANKLEKDFPLQAIQLREDIAPDFRRALFYLTNGSPIALAVALQIYIDQPSKELESLIDEQLKSPSQAVPNAERRLQIALAKSLAEQQMFGDTSTAIRYMALARKGLTPDRLRGLLPGDLKIDFDAIFATLLELIIVKQRPDGSLVLHDKIADWTEEGLYGVDELRSRNIYGKMVELYDQEISDIDHKIDELGAKADPVESNENEQKMDHILDLQRDPFAHENSQDFRQSRRRRRNLLIERMTYALRSNPVLGYKQYFELAEEVFNVGRMDYESQIRSEFLGWWDHQEPINSGNYKYRGYASLNGLSEELIRADFVIRTVQRQYNRESPDNSPAERMQSTVELVRHILEEVRVNQLQIPEFAQILLAVYADTANGQLAESEEDIVHARTSFRAHINQLNQLLEQSRNSNSNGDDEEPLLSLETFLVLNALAFAQYELGFFESNHGNHGHAIESYTRSLLPYRELHFEINQARSLNDKAYSLAMMGDSDSAETAVGDAIRLRKRLGFSYLAALSYNTMGIVRTMGERPITAVRYCDYALRTFRGLNHEFGQMIASRALSEAYRRSAEYLYNDRAGQFRSLENALAASLTATKFAEYLLRETDLILSEVLDEAGCAYRDMARFRFQNLDLCKDKYEDAFAESENLLKKAIVVAQDVPSARTNLVDSMINLAYLSFYQLNREGMNKAEKETILAETKQLITNGLTQVPVHYSSPTNPQHDPHDLTVYWAHLAKARSLLVRVARARLDLLGRDQENRTERETLEDELLQESIYTLYFRSLLQGNVRTVRRSHLAVYEAFQSFSVFTLNRLYKRAKLVSQELEIPETIIVGFLKKDFGLI